MRTKREKYKTPGSIECRTVASTQVQTATVLITDR